MLNLVYFLFTLCIGAVAGYIGVIGEATVLTDRAVETAMKHGACFCCVFACVTTFFWPYYTIPLTALAVFVGMCRWHMVIPLINWIAKVAYTVIQNKTR